MVLASPIIMRYVLHTCATVDEAVAVLQRIPSHMAYNVTIVDKSGAFKTVMVTAGGGVQVTDQRTITNHQAAVVWSEQASFSKTIERKSFLDDFISTTDCTADTLTQAFLAAPLRSTQFDKNFGTVYTAVYLPKSGQMRYVWTTAEWSHDFKTFKDSSINVDLHPESNAVLGSNEDYAYTHTNDNRIFSIIESLMQHMPTELLPNPQAAQNMQRAAQGDYDWTQFATDFAGIWVQPMRGDAVEPNFEHMAIAQVNENEAEVEIDEMTLETTFQPPQRTKPRAFSCVFH